MIKRKRYSVEVVAVDQVGLPVSATVLSKTGEGLSDGHVTQDVSQACTKLNFNIFSPNDEEKLIVHAESPALQPQQRLDIHFTDCASLPSRQRIPWMN